MTKPSPELAALMQRGRDIEVFATEILGVRLNRAQLRWMRYAAATEDGWRWAWRRVFHVAANQIGKASHVDEPVLTPSGWRSIGSLRMGDEVFAGDGSVTVVTGVFPQGTKPIFRLTFDDGAWTRTCDEHLWKVREPEARFRKISPRYGEWTVRTLAELRKAYGDHPKPPRRWSIPAPGPVLFPYRPVPIDPYVLGLLIGDGSFVTGICYATADAELLDAVRRACPDPITIKPRVKFDYTVTVPTGQKNPWMDALRSLGLWGKHSESKFVPDIYKFNSPEVRLAILQGLMDTDGSITVRGGADFNSVSRRLAEDVVELVRSLGGKASISPRQTYYTHKGERRAGQPSYRVLIRCGDIPLFRLERKRERMIPRTRCAERVIHRIERVEDAEAVCIQVAHPDQTYITRDHIVTHNTLGVAILILWACLYKIGVDPTDQKAWYDQPYTWFHLAPTQQQAYHALKDARQLIKGSHPAQVDTFRLPAGLVTEARIANYYDGLGFWNGSECQFRTTDDKAAALQGYRASGISVDEAAFEDHLWVIVNETLMMRLAAARGPLHLVSTPNGMNDYFDLVEEVKKLNVTPEERVWIDERSEFRSAVTWSVIDDNVGYGLSAAEVARLEETIDPATKDQQLRGAFLSPGEAFFVPADRVLSAFRSHLDMAKRNPLPVETAAQPGHRYVAFWDPSLENDPTAVIVLDVTQKPYVGVYFRHYLRPMGLVELVNAMKQLHLLYGNAIDPTGLREKSRVITGFDATAMGGIAIKQSIRDIQPQYALNFGGPDKKLKALTNCRAFLTSGHLWLPDTWTRVRQEVFSYKLKDEKIKNDCVTALVGAVYVASMGPSHISRPFDTHGRVITPRRYNARCV